MLWCLVCQASGDVFAESVLMSGSNKEHVESHQTSGMTGQIPLSITVACAQVSHMNCASQHADDRLPICEQTLWPKIC